MSTRNAEKMQAREIVTAMATWVLLELVKQKWVLIAWGENNRSDW